jgi:hypothetical protein
MTSSWHRLIPFLPFPLNHLGLPSPELGQILSQLLFCTTYMAWRRILKNTSSYIVAKACLPRRCLATDVVLFSAFASPGMCLASHCLVMGIHVTILKWLSEKKSVSDGFICQRIQRQVFVNMGMNIRDLYKAENFSTN